MGLNVSAVLERETVQIGEFLVNGVQDFQVKFGAIIENDFCDCRMIRCSRQLGLYLYLRRTRKVLCGGQRI
jgi:hypothetical protein